MKTNLQYKRWSELRDDEELVNFVRLNHLNLSKEDLFKEIQSEFNFQMTECLFLTIKRRHGIGE